MYDIAIIGAGASGMAAAISAKKDNYGAKILLIEALPRVGKKILATGNGRCNLTNLSATAKDYNDSFVSYVLEQYPPEKIVDFFSSIGLECVADGESRVYPMSNTASSVLDCLRYEVERLGIELMTETKVESVENSGGVFNINSTFKSKRLIISTGGKASPSQGSDGSGYPLLKALGHTVTPTYPGLVQLETKENVKAIKGIRVKAESTLKDKKGKTIDKACGEVLFTDYGLSGIAIMDISRSVKNNDYLCSLNLLPETTKEDIVDFVLRSKKRNPAQTLDNALGGIVPRKLGQAIMKTAGIHSDTPLEKLKYQQIEFLAEKFKAYDFTVTGVKGFNNAQITVGGAVLSEFDMKTLESKLVKGLYCTGELLDVDAPCGGYNLQWAWASGIVAGKSAANIRGC